MSHETPVNPQPKIERPNGQRPAAAAKKSLQLSPTTTVIILMVIAAVIFFLPTNKASTPAPVAAVEPAAPVAAEPAPGTFKILTPAQEDLQYQSLVQQVISIQQELSTVSQKLQTLQEMMVLLQQNEHAKSLLNAEDSAAKKGEGDE